MAFPTLFRIVADLIGIGVGVASDYKEVPSEVYESSKANSMKMRHDMDVIRMRDKEKKHLLRVYFQKLNASNLQYINPREHGRITRQIYTYNFYYLKYYFDKYFPELKDVE